jgi:hypothetical protein
MSITRYEITPTSSVTINILGKGLKDEGKYQVSYYSNNNAIVGDENYICDTFVEAEALAKTLVEKYKCRKEGVI